MAQTNKRILIQRISNLPTLPTILTKIIDLSDSPDASASDLGKVLSQDQSISSLILKLVNSAFYGNLRHISSINHAIVILGFQMVKTIAMGVSIYQSRAPTQKTYFDRERFWMHSLGVAQIAKMLAEQQSSSQNLDKDAVFLAGLLHDVGKVVFDNYFSEDYQKVAELVHKENLWIRVAEERILGMDHCEAGYFLSRKWQFPTPIVEAIRFHHQPESCSADNRHICALVHTADYACRTINLGNGGDTQQVTLNPIIQDFGITDEIIETVLEKVETNRHEIESFASG